MQTVVPVGLRRLCAGASKTPARGAEPALQESRMPQGVTPNARQQWPESYVVVGHMPLVMSRNLACSHPQYSHTDAAIPRVRPRQSGRPCLQTSCSWVEHGRAACEGTPALQMTNKHLQGDSVSARHRGMATGPSGFPFKMICASRHPALPSTSPANWSTSSSWVNSHGGSSFCGKSATIPLHGGVRAAGGLTGHRRTVDPTAGWSRHTWGGRDCGTRTCVGTSQGL